jgi:2-oxoglutarate ferredoxin oxidoreductase subunit alpha
VPVSGKNLFPSNIAGLPTWYTIRANHRGYISRKKEIDFCVAMNAETANEDVMSLRPGAAVVYDEPLKLNALRNDLIFYPVPFDKIVNAVTTDAKLRRLVRNMVYDGVLSHLLSIDLAEMEKALSKQLGKKPKALQLNMSALEAGRQYSVDHFQIQHPYKIERLNKDRRPDSGRRQRSRGDGLHVRRRHRRRVVSDHAIVVIAGIADRLHAEVPHGQSHGEGDLRDRAG